MMWQRSNADEIMLDEAATEYAQPILRECGCTKVVGLEKDCRHDRIYEDRRASFIAGANWQREQPKT